MKVKLLIHEPGVEIWLAQDDSISDKKESRRSDQREAAYKIMREAGRTGPVEYSPFGKPELAGCTEEISLSHTKKWVACGFHSKGQIGIDIECFNPKASVIRTKFLSTEELKLAHDIPGHTLLWSIKEAAYKWYGRKNLRFIEDLNIQSINLKKQTARIHVKPSNIDITAKWRLIDNLFLVWAV